MTLLYERKAAPAVAKSTRYKLAVLYLYRKKNGNLHFGAGGKNDQNNRRHSYSSRDTHCSMLYVDCLQHSLFVDANTKHYQISYFVEGSGGKKGNGHQLETVAHR